MLSSLLYLSTYYVKVVWRKCKKCKEEQLQQEQQQQENEQQTAPAPPQPHLEQYNQSPYPPPQQYPHQQYPQHQQYPAMDNIHGGMAYPKQQYNNIGYYNNKNGYDNVTFY